MCQRVSVTVSASQWHMGGYAVSISVVVCVSVMSVLVSVSDIGVS